MFPHVRSYSVLATACVLAAAGSATAQPMSDMCSQPKMKTDKWHSISAPAGMTLMIPQGYVVRGNGSGTMRDMADARFFWSGEHRWIAVGSGAGPSALTWGSGANRTDDCETQIAGRRVEISKYEWTNEDGGMSPSGNAGGRYVAVARFFSTASQRESFIAYQTNIQSDVSSMRQLFWTASFGGDTPVAAAAPATQVAASGPAAATPAAACTPRPEPNLPALDAVVDSSVVQMLVANAAPPIPKGFEVISLKFDDQGGVSGISVAESDLPDPTQRQLTTLVASNLKQKDPKAPSTFLLRVETQAPGVRYQVLPIASCAP